MSLLSPVVRRWLKKHPQPQPQVYPFHVPTVNQHPPAQQERDRGTIVRQCGQREGAKRKLILFLLKPRVSGSMWKQ